jgi:hypothetical protein
MLEVIMKTQECLMSVKESVNITVSLGFLYSYFVT